MMLTDPTAAPAYGDGWLSRALRTRLFDPRDEVFARLSLSMVATMTSAMVALAYVLTQTRAPAAVAMAAYLTLWGWLAPPVILMLHNTMHRRFIRSPRAADLAHPFVMSFFFGIPTGYREHHLGMHHAEDNQPDDLSSTVRYRRDSFASFLVYFLRFFLLIIVELPLYLLRRRRRAMAWRALVGELAHLAVMTAACAWDVRFGLTAFVVPFVVTRFMMMAGNWGQHAFINTERENDGLSNSITCINSPYNRRCFNDGYHIGHHLKASRHWSELPGDFIAHRDQYARAGALVFEGLDFFAVSLLLWLGRWQTLARHVVSLDGAPRPVEEVIELLKARVKPVRLGSGEGRPVRDALL
ncbi:MAG: fatty acid desaturase [Myxococcaceae bacterium]|nr:fatty acid desaturase [Myxococcaceae bacterium]